MALDRAGVFGRGEVSADSVKQSLNALVLERRTADHRVDSHGKRAFADSGLDLIYCDCGRIVEIFLHQVLVKLSESLEHLVAVFLSLCDEVCRNLLDGVLSAHCLVVPEDGLHVDQVDNALECLFSADRDLDGKRIGAEHILDLADNLEEVGSGAVHFVYVTDTGHIVFVGLTPDSLALGLNATHCAESSHCSVEHTQRTFHLHGEVDVPRSVDKIDLILLVVIFPECRSSR